MYRGYSKYRAKPCVIDGIRFASQKEGRRYKELRLLEKAEKISELRLQVKYPMWVNFNHICNYIGDFEYEDEIGAIITEDTKGVRTPIYRLKRKLFKALYGKDIVET